MSKSGKRNGTRSVLHRLSGEPGLSWGERIAHHGARVMLLVLLAALVTALFPPSRGSDSLPFEEWSVAPEDVIAEIAFTVPKSAADLESERGLAMEAVPPTFDFLPEAAATMAERLERFFDVLDSAAASGDRASVADTLRGRGIIATPQQVDYILEETSRNGLRRASTRAAQEIIGAGVVGASSMSNLTTNRVTIRESELVERTANAEDVMTSRGFFEQAVLLLPPGTAPDESDLFNLVLINHVEYSYVLNVVATEMDRDAAARSVEPIRQAVVEGEAIVRQADPIGPEALDRLRAYESERRAQGLFQSQEVAFGPMFGAGLVTFMLVGLFGLLLFFNRPEVYGNFRWLVLLALLVAAYFGAAFVIDRAGMSAEWLPIAFVALPVAVLWDTRMALFLVLVVAAITGALAPFASYGTFLVLVAAGCAAALSVRAVRRRSETWVSIAIIAASGGMMLLAHGLATSRDLTEVLSGTAFIAGNATVSALLAMGFLFVFELFTGITTDQTLLEWADPTRPLLRKLSLEAPGTYAHTINVANLSEAAALGIGANGLLSRVGVYYHDVGKMLKPHYFVENQPDGRNPHDKLKPATSAEIVREHVTEGVRLAREGKVPDVVIDFILEHHGTQRIGFFYEKAREEAEGDVDVDRFFYPGPKPQSKETAIVMLADSCESATRAMHEPTPERLQDLIDTIVSGKIADGQLDESPLTLHEIAQVKAEFVKILGGVIHRRIEYPATKHLTDADGENGAAEQEPAIESAPPEQASA